MPGAARGSIRAMDAGPSPSPYTLAFFTKSRPSAKSQIPDLSARNPRQPFSKILICMALLHRRPRYELPYEKHA